MTIVDRRNPPVSPCNSTCIVDRKQNWCVGCLRTLDEIGRWAQMTAAEQWAVMDQVESRRASQGRRGA
jgi:predicted Fe-S protein YdhL (DUF1289 family)